MNDSTAKTATLQNGARYLGITRNATPEQAAAAFVKRFGNAPLGVFDTGAIWLVGPVAPAPETPQQDRLF